MTQCSLADRYRRFRGTAACIFMVVEGPFSKVAARSSETSVPLRQITLHHTPQKTRELYTLQSNGLQNVGLVLSRISDH